jgi:hypothetical protein
MYFEMFDKDDPVFNRKLVNKYILIIKKGRSGSALENAKIDLFKLMKKVIIKNVKNYVNLSRNSSVTSQCLDENEMYCESFIVLMRCADKFNVKKKNCFYFYFNKSLARTFYRMFDKEVRKLDGFRGYSTQKQSNHNAKDLFREDIYSVEFVADNLVLDDFDRRVLKSKMEFQKKDDFIVNNEDANISRYYASIRKIKEQVQNLKDNGDI